MIQVVRAALEDEWCHGAGVACRECEDDAEVWKGARGLAPVQIRFSILCPWGVDGESNLQVIATRRNTRAHKAVWM